MRRCRLILRLYCRPLASGYSYDISRDSIITMNGEGAVGYKVYDNEGNLLYFANTNTFTLPQSVVKALAADGKSMVVKVAQPDGTDVTLPAPGATTYMLKVYRADALSVDKSSTVYTVAQPPHCPPSRAMPWPTYSPPPTPCSPP